MKIVKLIVLFCFVISGQCFQLRYCEICNNHTLCKYPDGPSSVCVDYEQSLLSTKDVQDIVNRINERRHLVTMGALHRFPQAANMNKLTWSATLASSAQRWVDQCDRFIKPDREDECRDLADMQVGQNIATVLGPSPGLTVKSFVDMWFMLNLHYTGSVTYYNQSRDSKTNYFTQLIWADTASVGCGRAKFFFHIIGAQLSKGQSEKRDMLSSGIRMMLERLRLMMNIKSNEQNTIVERIVCNFAPRGNVHGKPVYAIGYPGTQCSKQAKPDFEYKGLCQYVQNTFKETNFINKVSTVNSLLRILDLSNHSMKQELDPNNLKQILINTSKADHRNQKTRHVYTNNSYGAIKRDSLHFQNSMPNAESYNDPHPQFTQRPYTERGHSRMYHGYQASKEPVFNIDLAHPHTVTDYRRTYLSTTSAPFYTNSLQDGRKHYVDGGCSRTMIPSDINNCCSPPEPPCKKTNECPHVQSPNCPQPNPCGHTALPRCEKPCNVCPCNEPPPPAPCSCNRNCQPTSCAHFTTTYCPYHRRAGGDDTNRKNNQFENYDLFHNLEVKSGEDSTPKQSWHFENQNQMKLDKNDYISRESEPNRQVKVIVDESQARAVPDSYRSFGYSERKKRDIEDQTFKPFWQMDEYNEKKKPLDLKNIKYTTLSYKKFKKVHKTTTTPRPQTITETITIQSKGKPATHNSHRGRVTEKYLSFDELMHLRKLSTIETVEGAARRQADDDNDLRAGKTGTTTTITANTPFIRQKQCTRKLTCTWTGPMPGGSGHGGNRGDGNGGGIDIGSRTPPGYVEGCTRTSTCTRIYMDRNKEATLTDGPVDGITVHGGGTPSTSQNAGEDEDYCERRSLNIRRRNLNEKEKDTTSVESQVLSTEFPLLSARIDELPTTHTIPRENDQTDSQTDNFHCICYEDMSRVKRGEIDQFLYETCSSLNQDENNINLPFNDHCKHVNERTKYNIKSYQCPCNGSKSLKNMFYGTITLNYYVTWLLFMFMMKILED